MRLGPHVHPNSILTFHRYQVVVSGPLGVCAGSFMRELAYFYSPTPSFVVSSPASDENEQENPKCQAWFLLDNDVVQVASLPDIYRVFERC
jgi:hypothetical protein